MEVRSGCYTIECRDVDRYDRFELRKELFRSSNLDRRAPDARDDRSHRGFVSIQRHDISRALLGETVADRGAGGKESYA